LLSQAERTLRARLGAYSQHAQHDPKLTTVRAREVFNQRFIDEVDPDRLLPESERLRRAEAARRAYFSRIRLKGLRTLAKRMKETPPATAGAA
jgi:hypothetical protein